MKDFFKEFFKNVFINVTSGVLAAFVIALLIPECNVLKKASDHVATAMVDKAIEQLNQYEIKIEQMPQTSMKVGQSATYKAKIVFQHKKKEEKE